MLLNSYSIEFVRLACASEAQTEDMIVHLDQDIG